MKNMLHKSIAMILMLVVTLALFAGCNEQQAETPAVTEKTAMVTIEVDGQEITVENPDGKNVQELLTLAGITLGSEDMVSVDPNKTSGDHMYIVVLRMNTVIVEVPAEDGEVYRYTVSRLGGTVADALEEVGVELLDNYTIQYELDQPLENGMTIVVSEKEENVPDVTEEPTTPATTPATAPQTTTPKPTTPKPTTPKPTTPQPTEPAPTAPPTTAPTQPAKTVVNVEYYYDCDGSGHGVKVITYSDGTQEEVYF